MSDGKFKESIQMPFGQVFSVSRSLIPDQAVGNAVERVLTLEGAISWLPEIFPTRAQSTASPDALCPFALQPQGITSKQLWPLLAQLLGWPEKQMTQGRMTTICVDCASISFKNSWIKISRNNVPDQLWTHFFKFSDSRNLAASLSGNPLDK